MRNITCRKFIWKLIVPLKIKILFWYACRGVILTKDNLVKRNWNGSTKCCYCSKGITIQRLLFVKCCSAWLLWRMVFLAFNHPRLLVFLNMFGKWLREVIRQLKGQIQVKCVLYVGQYGIVVFVFNKRNKFLISCRLFIWPLIGSIDEVGASS